MHGKFVNFVAANQTRQTSVASAASAQKRYSEYGGPDVN